MKGWGGQNKQEWAYNVNYMKGWAGRAALQHVEGSHPPELSVNLYQQSY